MCKDISVQIFLGTAVSLSFRCEGCLKRKLLSALLVSFFISFLGWGEIKSTWYVGH
jgi:hypothetical protein